MTAVAIDIETIPDQDKITLFRRLRNVPPELLAEWMKKSETLDEYHDEYYNWEKFQMSLLPEYCRIVAMNYMVELLEPVSLWVGEKVRSNLKPDTEIEVSEVSLLRKFWQLAKENSTIVTFNGLSFDLEVIKFRSALLGVSSSCDLANLKPWESRVIDLMKRLYTNRKAMGLKKLRLNIWHSLIKVDPRLLEYEDILDLEGSDVLALYTYGNIPLLKRYGEFDVLTNMAIYTWGRGYWW